MPFTKCTMYKYGQNVGHHATRNVEIFCGIRGFQLPSRVLKKYIYFLKKLTWIPQSFYTRRRIKTRPTAADAVAGYFRCSGKFESWQTFQQFWSFQSRKEKTFNKGMGAKKEKKKVPRWEEDSSSYTHHFLSTGAEAAAEARHSSPCQWINPAFILPNLHVKNASVFGLSDSWEWLRIRTGGKTRQVAGKLFQTENAASSSLALAIQWGVLLFFFFVHVNTAAVLICPLCRHGCNIGSLSCKATVIQQQTCCDRLGPMEP